METVTTFKIDTKKKTILSDVMTPVSAYLRIRDRFPNSILLESSDYHGAQDSMSYICYDPVGAFRVENGVATLEYPDGSTSTEDLKEQSVVDVLSEYMAAFDGDEKQEHVLSGLFGYITYDAVKYFENIEVSHDYDDVPEINYKLYKNIIAFDHFRNQAHLISHDYTGDGHDLQSMEELLRAPVTVRFPFKITGAETANCTDADFIYKVKQGKQHCFRGDVFQVVFSRRFTVPFQGDEFNVYRSLRAINPSPYLFYFDFGDHKVMGSSPEAQLVVREEMAEIHPIAGTFRRTGDDIADTESAKALAKDRKENAEHVMLVDLARNDLSRHGEEVEVETFKEIQFYSHVIHLVSKVTAKKYPSTPTMQLVADTFPAGTLSGAPKHRAMQLIEQYEEQPRGYYGGAIGYLGFDGEFNHAIMIRSFLSKNNKLHFQAGAGVVADSVPEKELQEVNNKLGALRKALDSAESI